jgi:mRNA interferase MazF
MTDVSGRDIDSGDVFWVELEPTKGTEQSGVRPAVVLSTREFNARSQHVIFCPSTRNVSPWPTKVILGDDEDVRGAVLVDQIRAVHKASRGFRHAGRVSPDALHAIRGILVTIAAPDFLAPAP